MNNPFFSIITVTKNCELDIENTLASVKLQTFTDYEHIVIDGFSEDKTFKLISNFNSKKIIKKQLKDVSCYDGFNNALKLINGKFFIFLHSGDFFYSDDTLKKISNNISDDIDLLHGNCIFYNERWKINRIWLNSSKQISKKDFYKIPHTATITNKKIIQKIGYFNLSYSISSDIEYLLKILSIKNINLKFINEPIVFMKIGGISTSSLNIFKRMKEDLSIIINNFGIFAGLFIYSKKIFFKLLQLKLSRKKIFFKKKLKQLKEKFKKYIELESDN